MLNEAKNAKRDFEDAKNDVASKTRTVVGDTIDRATDTAAAVSAALSDLRRIVDDFAARTGQTAEQAAETVKDVSSQTVHSIGAVATDARTIGRDGLDALAGTVAKRPLGSLAIAVGIGLAIGLVSTYSAQPGSRR